MPRSGVAGLARARENGPMTNPPSSQNDRFVLAQAALDSYPGELDVEEAMIDLVSDLRCLAAAKGIDWIKVVDLAEIHFDDESEEA